MSTTIQVTEDVRIHGDGVGWTVQSRHVAEKSGVERWEFEGCYVSPTAALQSLIDGRNTGLLLRSVARDEDVFLSLEQFVERVERAVRLVTVAVKRSSPLPPPAVSASRSR